MDANWESKTAISRASVVRKRIKLPDTPKRARKRALDREAQRTFREKTKSYITHLERTVETCKTDNQSQLVTQLLAENATLYSTIERLRKILSDIYNSILPDIPKSRTTDLMDAGNVTERRSSWPQTPAVATPSAGEHVSAERLQANRKDTTSNSLTLATSRPGSTNSWDLRQATVPELRCPLQRDDEPDRVEMDAMTNDYVGITIPTGTPTSSEHNVLQYGDDLFNSQEIPDRDYALLGPQKTKDDSSTNHEISVMCESPFLSSPVAFNADFELYDLWHATNTVYDRIYRYTPIEAAAGRDADSGSIFKAIKHGWSVLSAADQANPVNQILREYDALICHKLDRVHRIAIAYKNYLMIKYHLNFDNEDLDRMPYWQRPRSFQRSEKHPILVDFFAWPGVRERFINGDMTIHSKKFAIAHLKYFRFVWPYPFEDTYQYCSTTDSYNASPLFQRCHRDLRSWSMDHRFFWEFPELAEDIPSSLGWDMAATAVSSSYLGRDSCWADCCMRTACE